MTTQSIGQETENKKGMGCGKWVALILTFIIVLILIVAFVLPAMSRRNQTARRLSCYKELQKIHGALYAYALDHDGFLPPLSMQSGGLVFDPQSLYPKYLDEITHEHIYYYLGYEIKTEEEALAFIEVYKEAVQQGSNFDEGGITIMGRLIPRIRIDDRGKSLASSIVLIIERPDHMMESYGGMSAYYEDQNYGAGHILFLDGTIKFENLSPFFPLTTILTDALAGMGK